MLECSSCGTLNSEMQAACLVCGLPLPAARPARLAPPQRCPAGHPFDPAWKSCPYCDRAASPAGARPAMGEVTQHEQTAGAGLGLGPPPLRQADGPGAAGSASAPTGAPWSAGPPAAARPTRLETAEAAGHGRRRTVLAQEPSSTPAAAQPPGAERAATAGSPRAPGSPSPAPGGPSAARPLVAVLAAPALQPGGMLFAVRAGKNTLGASAAADICLARDPTVSDEHALLLYRNGAFLLADRVSTNGTWVNGREVPANGTVELLDRDRIRCGDVELQLLAVAPAAPPPGPAAEATDAARK